MLSTTPTIIFTAVGLDGALNVVWGLSTASIVALASDIAHLYVKLSLSWSVASTDTSTVELQITGFSDTVIEFITGLWFWARACCSCDICCSCCR